MSKKVFGMSKNLVTTFNWEDMVLPDEIREIEEKIKRYHRRMFTLFVEYKISHSMEEDGSCTFKFKPKKMGDDE